MATGLSAGRFVARLQSYIKDDFSWVNRFRAPFFHRRDYATYYTTG